MPPDLDRYRTTVRRWEVSEAEGAALLRVEADHRVDTDNGFTAAYEYRVRPEGTLEVEYAITPQVALEWLPEVGIELHTAPGLGRFRWLGLGPLDASPNQRAAVSFGLWQAERGDPEGAGTKGDVQWMTLTDEKGRGLRLTGGERSRIHSGGGPYVRLEGSPGAEGRLRVLARVTGRSSKFNPPERPEYRIEASASPVLRGRFHLQPEPGGRP